MNQKEFIGINRTFTKGNTCEQEDGDYDKTRKHSTENIPCGITTLEEFADYINKCDEFPLAAYDIITTNGWTDETAEIFGVCSCDNRKVVLNEGVAEVIEL